MNRNPLIAKVPAELKPQPKVNAQTSALVDSGEGEDSDEGDTNPAVKQAPTKKSTPVKSSVKPSNLFDPIVIQVNKLPTRPRVVPLNNK